MLSKMMKGSILSISLCICVSFSIGRVYYTSYIFTLLITIIITFAILIYLYLSGEKQSSKKINGEYTILLNVSNSNYNKACEVIVDKTTSSKVIRSETENERTSVYFNVSIDREFDLQKLIENLNLIDKDCKIDFVESGVNW